MQLSVELAVARQLGPCHGRAHVGDDAAQRRCLRRGDALRGAGRQEAFQQLAHLGDLDRLAQRYLAHPRAPVPLELDQALRGQVLEGSPGDEPGRAVALAQVGLDKPLPGRVLPLQDRRAERPGNRGPGAGRGLLRHSHHGTGGVPWVWNDAMVASPQACPFARSASVQLIGAQSGAKISRATGLHSSIRLPPGSYT